MVINKPIALIPSPPFSRLINQKIADSTNKLINITTIFPIDFMPTILSLAGVSLPDDRQIDGQDQTDLLLGKSENGRNSFVYDQVSQVDVPYMAIGIRKGKWKLLLPGREPAEPHRYVMDYGTNDYELYDLDTDIGERWNLAYDYPEIVEKLEAEIGRFKATVK